MKILGKIKGNEVVLDKEAGRNALTLKRNIPDPSESERAIQLERSIDGYKPGDILLSDGESWNKLGKPSESVGSVSNIVRPRIGREVQIRWIDPLDTEEYSWKHTRLLRKYGEYPTSPLDGVVVVDSYTRNYFTGTTAVHDMLPTGTEDNWKYRFYTFSEDEVSFTADSCCFEPIELSTENLRQIVRDGNAPYVFALGDIVEITLTNHDSRKYTTQFEVVGFNNVNPADVEQTHTLTFAMCDVFHDENGNICLSRFDDHWEEYFLTSDTYVVDRNKIYYKKNAQQVFEQATDLRLGQRLPAGVYYELNENHDRITNGGNRWSASALREWLNSTDPSNTWITTTTTGNTYTFKPILTMFPEDWLELVTSVKNITARPTVDGPGYDVTVDKIYIPSRTEVFNETQMILSYKATTDKNPKLTYEITADVERVEGKTYYLLSGGEFVIAQENSFNPDGSFKDDVFYYEGLYLYYLLDEGEYRLAREDEYTDDHEFRSDLVYFECIIDAPDENMYLPKFGDTELDSRKKSNSWWLRSANRTSNSTMCYVDQLGNFKDNEEHPTANNHGLAIMFTVA